MTDQTTDDQANAVTTNWYDDFAGDDPERAETLSKFDSFDSFLEDYQSAKNFDWRGAIAGDDDKFKSTLERYADPLAFGNAHREAVQKIRSGQMQEPLPADADEETIKEYRRNNGIPLEAEGYLNDLPDGLVVGEEDKELMIDFLSAIHAQNAPPQVAHAVVEWYNNFAEQQQEAIQELDEQQAREVTDMLRDPEEGWGKDFRANMNLVKGMLQSFLGEESYNQLLNGRYQDGRGFFNDPHVLMGMANMARKINDVAPLIEQDPQKMQALEDEIAELEKYMSTKRSEYMKDEKAQARLRELYEIRLSTNAA